MSQAVPLEAAAHRAELLSGRESAEKLAAEQADAGAHNRFSTGEPMGVR